MMHKGQLRCLYGATFVILRSKNCRRCAAFIRLLACPLHGRAASVIRSMTTDNNTASPTTASLEFTPTCDLYDVLLDEHARIPVSADWKHYGGHVQFCGPAVTVQCYEDNSRVKELVGTAGQGRVLVVDGGGSCRRALLGDLLAQQAVDQAWRGMVVYGAVRDVEVLRTLPIGIMALGCTPRKSIRRDQGVVNATIEMGGATCAPGDYVFCDANGVLMVSPEAYHSKVLTKN